MRLLAAIVAALSVAPLAGCDSVFGLDNYDPPNAVLSGRVVFEGQALGLRMGGVQLELWEPGWDFDQKIPVYINADGSFSASVFDGDYELNLLPGNGPWVDNASRIPVQVRGNTAIDVPVAPYYTIQNASFRMSADSIYGTFQIRSVNPSKAIEFAGIYVGKTAIVDRNNQAVRREILRASLPASGPVTIGVKLPADIRVTPSPDLREQVFVRIGVKTLGVAELVYSTVQEVPL